MWRSASSLYIYPTVSTIFLAVFILTRNHAVLVSQTMTRVAYNVHTNPDIASVSLSRLLARLDERLFQPENAPELARNPYLRTKYGVVCCCCGRTILSIIMLIHV